VGLWLKEKHMRSTKKQLRNSLSAIKITYYRQNLKTASNDNSEQRNSCSLFEDIIIEFASR
jgi:hypothetical protein